MEEKEMNEYECVVVIRPNLNEKELKELIEKINEMINQTGKVTKIEEMGKKKLAYEVKKNKEGYYVIYYFEIKPEDKEAISNIERFYRITDEILKFIVIRKD